MASNSIICYNDKILDVNLTGNTVTTGETWSAWDNLLDPDRTGRYCVEMVTTANPGTGPLLVQNYLDCYDCLSDNYGVYGFSNCIRGQLQRELIVTAEEFGSLPNINDTYYMTLQRPGIDGGVEVYVGCFQLTSINQIPKQQYEAGVLGNKFFTITTTPELESSCETCLTSNSLPYEVTRCTDGGTIDYVSLINDTYINHIISYSDGLNEYCGVVNTVSIYGSPIWTFINDYGLVNDGESCDICLATANEKLLLVSCTDSEVTQVVWSSALYDGGEVSSLSTDAGCFTVVGPTIDDVTIDSFLNFDPQPGCEPCIECNGIVYSYETCYGVSGLTESGFISFSGNSEEPLAVGYNPDTQHMYVTTQTTRMIVIDPSTNTEFTRYSIPGGGNISDILYYDTNLMYLTRSSGIGGIIELDTSSSITGTTVAYNLGGGVASYYVEGDFPNNRLFITCSDYSVKIFDTTTNTVTASITTVSGYDEKFLAYHPGNNEVYTTVSSYYTVEVYDVTTLSHLQSINLVESVYDIAYEPNSGNMYVTSSGYYNVKVIDTTTKTVIATIDTNQSTGRIKYNSTDGYMYVTTTGGLLAINPSTNSVILEQLSSFIGNMCCWGLDFYDVNNTTYVNANGLGTDSLRVFEIQNNGIQSGYIESYQYLPSNSVFYNPAIDECCNITGTASGYVGDDTLYSVVTFTGNDDDCAECLINGQPNIQIWNASACTASNTYSSFYVTTDLTAVQGDVVKLMWGSNEWICAQLLNTTSSNSGYYTYYNTQNNGSGTTLSYDSCENCNSQGLIGVTLVSCNTPYTEQFVSITLDNYLQIYNFGSLTNYSVSDSFGRCYTITNLCPIPLTANDFTPVEFYLDCIICNSTDRTRNSGTESLICEICCDCGATGSTINQITPPHPVWSDGYGVQVRQLNMIVLGGPNGLNN